MNYAVIAIPDEIDPGDFIKTLGSPYQYRETLHMVSGDVLP
jgi:hypothetical protein